MHLSMSHRHPVTFPSGYMYQRCNRLFLTACPARLTPARARETAPPYAGTGMGHSPVVPSFGLTADE